MLVRPTYSLFLASVTTCGFASFLFGYHVHEKAVLLIFVPLAYEPHFFTLLMLRLLTVRRKLYLHALRIITAAGCVSLLPLLFTPQGSGTRGNSRWLCRKCFQTTIYNPLLHGFISLSRTGGNNRATLLFGTVCCCYSWRIRSTHCIYGKGSGHFEKVWISSSDGG